MFKNIFFIIELFMESVVTTPAVAAPVVETHVEHVVSETTTKPTEDDLSQAYSGCTAKLSQMRQMSALILELRTLHKRSEREMKAVQKAGNKRKQRNANRAPSGFVKPTLLISDQLAAFLSKPKGTLIARTEVTREINAYIRANKLQDDKNGRKINPDAKLKELLTLKATDELTYFNLQRYMSQHFQKSTPAAV